MMFKRRRAKVALLVASCAVAAAACTATPSVVESGPAPDATVAAFAAAWQGLKAEPIAALTSDPGSAAQAVGSVIDDLAPTKVMVTSAKPQLTDANNATSTATFAWTLKDGITWRYTANWAFARDSTATGWKAQWASTLINPQLGDNQTVALRTTDATDGTILDRDHQEILSPVTVYSVVALPNKMTNVNAAAASLAKILGKLDPTVTAASVVAGVKAAKPSVGYTVTNLRESEYQHVRAGLNAISGLSFPSTTRNLPATKDFAKILLSEAEPVASKLVVGTPGWEIDSLDSTGADLTTLAAQPAKPGANVTLTLDSAVQKAAESALAGTKEPAMLVAIQPSTGEILAVAQNQPANAQGPLALMGEYPPGSTFKIVTATAGFDHKVVTPTTPVDCPGQIVVEHREIHNEGFELGTVPLTTAFAKSCNTTFAELATQMPDSALTNAAAQYGIGRDFVIPGLTTLTGKVPAADSDVQKAENGFGQGVVLVTPFSSRSDGCDGGQWQHADANPDPGDQDHHRPACPAPIGGNPLGHQDFDAGRGDRRHREETPGRGHGLRQDRNGRLRRRQRCGPRARLDRRLPR